MSAQEQQHHKEKPSQEQKPARQQQEQAPAAQPQPIQLKAKAVQRRAMSGQDSFLEPSLDPGTVVQAAQSLFSGAPKPAVRTVDLNACGIAAGMTAFIRRCITTKEAQYDSGYQGGGLGIMGAAARVVLTVDITNERARAAQNPNAQTTGGQTTTSGNSQSNTTTTTGGVSGEVSGDGGKAGASGSVASANTSGSTTGGSATGGGNYGTIMEDCDIGFTIDAYTQDTGVGSVFAATIGALAGVNHAWNGHGYAIGGHAICRRPDPNRPT